MRSVPVRIAPDLYDAAGAEAKVMSRSIAQQVIHWARIGRELEASPDISIQEISQVLRHERSYDDLDSKNQAVVRAHWEEKIEALSGGLRLDEEFASEGRPWVELDSQGQVVQRGDNRNEAEP